MQRQAASQYLQGETAVADTDAEAAKTFSSSSQQTTVDQAAGVHDIQQPQGLHRCLGNVLLPTHPPCHCSQAASEEYVGIRT